MSFPGRVQIQINHIIIIFFIYINYFSKYVLATFQLLFT